MQQFVTYPEKDSLGMDQIYMINLLRRPERRRRMHRCFDELGLEAETIDAVDGKYVNSTISPIVFRLFNEINLIFIFYVFQELE